MLAVNVTKIRVSSIGGFMKKLFGILALAFLPLILTGCSSNIVAKFDDYNEVFVGKSYYDPVTVRATIVANSLKNNVECHGNAHMYQYPMWQFNLKCSDGRVIDGTLQSTKLNGTAFTSRNEAISFTVSKKQSTIKSAQSTYQMQLKDKPELDKTKLNYHIHL